MKHHFQRNLFLHTSIVITCFMLITSVIFSQYAYRNLLTDSVRNLADINLKTANEINNLLANMDSLALNISTNQEVRNIFTLASNKKLDNSLLSSQSIPVLTSAMIPNSVSKFKVSLYNQRGNFISSGISYNQDIPDYQTWYDTRPILKKDGVFLTIGDDLWSNASSTVITLYRNIYHTSYMKQSTGIIEIQCPIKYILEIMSASTDIYHYILYDTITGEILLTDPVTSGNTAEESLFFTNNLSVCEDLFEKTSYITSAEQLNGDWSLLMLRSKSSILKPFLPWILFIIFLYVLFLSVCLIIIYFTTKKVTRPLTMLIDEVQQITLNRLSFKMPDTDCPDEFTRLQLAFTQMVERLSSAMEENIKQKTYEVQANMIALQSQMNPHFLYNILAVIKSQAHDNDPEKIGNTCNYLAQMLRYISVYDQESVPLSRELEHAASYLQLMKIRYESSFRYTIKMDDALSHDQVYLPRLSIQPLLENCFQHGFKKVLPVWEIDIHCTWKDSLCIIEIKDNGSGFEESSLVSLDQKVRQFLENPSVSLPSLKLGGMGLVNTIVRMKLKYYEHFSYEILPCTPCGTKIIFTIGDFEHEHLTD